MNGLPSPIGLREEHHDKGDHDAGHKHSEEAHGHSSKAHERSTHAHGKSGEAKSSKR